MKFILRWLATAIAVAVAVWLVPGVTIFGGNEAWGAIALFAVILSLINLAVKPILQVLSLPITIITLGIFYLVINTLLLYLAGWIANGLFEVGFVIDSFGSAFIASIVISVVGSIVNAITGATKEERR